MSDLTPEESVRALVRLGVPQKRAEAAVAKLGGNLDQLQWRFAHAGDLPAQIDRIYGVKRLRLPWSALLPDNRKFGVVAGKIINTREYRAAKKKARQVAIEQLGEEPFKGAVKFEARVWFPNETRRRDVVNFSKLVNDALKGIAYLDDSQIEDNRWVRAGIDVDAPRAEITVTLLPPSQ